MPVQATAPCPATTQVLTILWWHSAWAGTLANVVLAVAVSFAVPLRLLDEV